MSLSSENMMKLMAYADGELDGEERLEAEMLLATDRDAATFIEQVAGLGELVELGHDARLGKAIAAFDVTGAVMTALSREETKPSKLVSLAIAREKKAASSSALKLGVAFAGVLALAASVFVFMQHRNDETPMAIAPSPAGPQGPKGAPAAGGTGGTGVAIDSAGKSVRVFYLPTANELSTSVVVWVDETGEK